MKFIRVKLEIVICADNEDRIQTPNDLNKVISDFVDAIGYSGKTWMPGGKFEIGFGKPPGMPGGLTRMGVFVPRAEGQTPRLTSERRENRGRRGAVSYSDRRGRAR